jgi:hypothetical protein
MSIWVTLDEFKDHLKLPAVANDPGDVNLQAQLDAAEAKILGYIGTTQVWVERAATWDALTVPNEVKHAVKIQGAEFWRFLGDDPAAENIPRADISNTAISPDVQLAVAGLLRRLRDPVLA